VVFVTVTRLPAFDEIAFDFVGGSGKHDPFIEAASEAGWKTY